MNKLRYTARFRRDYRKGLASGCDSGKLKALLELLRLGAPLPLDSRDAPVRGTEARACRVEPGWQLIYRVKAGTVTLLRVKLIRRERPKLAPPMGLWFRTLLRSPVKTALTVLLLASATFLLLDNLSSYAMQTRALREAEAKVEGVLTVERSTVSNPQDGTSSWFLLTDPTNPGETYRKTQSYESIHHEALTPEDLAALEALPYIDGVDRRYMTAGVSEDFTRGDGAYGDYGYMDRLVIEATVVSSRIMNKEFNLYSRLYSSSGARHFALEDVNVLAGDRKTLDQQLDALDGKARLIVLALSEKYIGSLADFRFRGMSGYAVDCMDYDVSEEQMLSIQPGRRYLFVVRAPRYDRSDQNTFGFVLGDDSRKDWWPYVTDITDLPENYLESEEFAPLRALIQVTNDDLRTFDVVYTDDMASLRRATRQQLYAARGRFLTPEDAGSSVCVVSEDFLERSGLELGDTITLKLGNVLMEQYRPLGAVAVTRGRYATKWQEQTFTVVGAWRDSSGRHWQEMEHYNYYSVGSWQEQDPYWSYSENAVFVPTSFLPESCDTENHRFRPAEVSFLVRDAANIAAFTEEGLPMVEALGLKYAWNDANWPIVSEKLAQTRSLTLVKLLIFVVASLLAAGLTLYLFLHRRRREYAILRALGSPRRAAARALWLPLLALALFSALLGLGAAWLRSGAAAKQSALEFAEAGLEAMPHARIGVYLLGALGLLAVTVLLAWAYLRALGKRSPLALLQDSEHRREKTGEAAGEIGAEQLERAAAVLALPVTAAGRPVKGFLGRYVLRHIRRAGVKTLLALLLAALLVGAVGQLTVLRARYGEMMASVTVDAGFYGGLSLSKANSLMKTGYFRDSTYQAVLSEAELEMSPAELIFTNRLDGVVFAPVTWLEGWGEERAMSGADKLCILPAPVMAELGIELGDEVRINELACVSHLMQGYHVYPVTWEEQLALRDAHRNFFTVVGRVETEESKRVIYASVAAFPYYSGFGTSLSLDSAVFTLNSYRDADKVRQLAEEIIYTAKKKPPVFRMDTSDADRIYRVYRLIETLYPLTVAAALLLGTLLPVLMILQEQREAAILRALGWPKKLTLRRLTLEQGLLCLAGLVLAVTALFGVNGLGFLGVLLVPLLYALAHLILCVTASAAISASILRKSPMVLLQVKE